MARAGQHVCGQIMVGSGGDTYDPCCELPPGHDGPCRSAGATDQHRLSLPVSWDTLNAPQRARLADMARRWDGNNRLWVWRPRGGQFNIARALERRGLVSGRDREYALTQLGLMIGRYCAHVEKAAA